MAWISYAQNAEDVRLRRAFAGQSTGFYIDVGANDPVENSITQHFYEKGWTGINVDPAPGPFAKIARDRRRDINLNVGCSKREGTLVLYAARGHASGLSSFTATEVEVHKGQGLGFDEITVPVTTLASICRQHVGNRTIDFLSIDVEGHEREVLEGADFDAFRPRVIVIEATRPNTTEPTHGAWERLILDERYLFAAFDGLNRYYVRSEDAELAAAIELPPNILDDFIPYRFNREIDKLTAELRAYRASNRVVSAAKQAVRAVKRAGDTLFRRK
jgi:FkbM family methyltransferase